MAIISFAALQTFVHDNLPGVGALDSIGRLKLISDGNLISISPEVIVDTLRVLRGFLHISDDLDGSLHTTLVKSVLDLKHIQKHATNELRLDSFQKRVGIALNEPELHVFIKHKIKSQQFIYIASFPEILTCHLNQVNKCFLQRRSQIIIQPIFVCNLLLLKS